MGPGVRGNNEWTECDCKRRLKTDDEKWRDHFVHPIALEMKINNNFTAHFARMFHIAHPRHDGFFRNRKLLSTSDEAAILERIRETIHP